MNYQAFAKVYDSLMQDAPYDRWIDYVKTRVNQAQLAGMTVLDVGCGTGELLVRLHEEGAHVTGVDLSAEMLTIARGKCEENDFHPLLMEQSMTDLEGLGSFDLVTVFCDSLNYLKTSEDVKKTFQGIYQHLNNEGLLLFDVHSIYKIEEGFVGHTFAEDDDEVSYIWTSFAGEYPASVEHEMTFFVLDEQSDCYHKIEELHKQRTFRVEQYKDWLCEAGFEVSSVTADFTEEQPIETSERIFICARKKE